MIKLFKMLDIVNKKAYLLYKFLYGRRIQY